MAWQQPKTTWGQAGQTVPGVADFNRIEENIRIVGEYDRAPGYGTATGTNAKTITLNPAPSSYYEGLCFAFKNSVENTGAVTINVNGLGAKAVKKPNGNDVAAGNLKAGSVYTVRYNGTNFILQGEGGEYGTAQPEHVLEGYTIGTEEGIKQGTMPNQGRKIITPSTTNIAIPQGYHDGTGYVEGSPNLISANIKKGINIFGIIGELEDVEIKSGQIYPRDDNEIYRYPSNGRKICIGAFSYTYTSRYHAIIVRSPILPAWSSVDMPSTVTWQITADYLYFKKSGSQEIVDYVFVAF